VSTTEFVKCNVCDVEREANTLDQLGRCPFCVDEEIPTETVKKSAKRRTVKAVKAVQNPEPEPSPSESVQITPTVIPYEPPVYTPASSPEQELALRVLCRRRLLPFIQRFRPKYLPGWVHEDICRRLERFKAAVERGESPRMLLMCPPRMGKSEIGSRHFAPWVLGDHPDWEIIAASHTSSLTLSFSRYVRDLMRDPAYHVVFPEARLDPSSQSIENWNTTKGGGYLAAGVGTGITGRGAHILLLDDLVKDIEAADSATIKDNTWEWYGSTAYTRLAPGGGVLGIMCMTGDTPVLMADGTNRRLDTLAPSDSIATYAKGRLIATTVAAVKKSGRDSVFKMTMKSGRVVRANQRHPFLTVSPDGELSWKRLRQLSTATRIVTVKGNGGSGGELRVRQKGVKSRLNVEDFATATTGGKDGSPVIGQKAIWTLNVDETQDSSIATGSRQTITTLCTKLKKGVVQFAENMRKRVTHLLTGKTNSQLTIATTLEKSEGYFATTAMLELDTLPLSQWHLPPQNISDFTLDEIVSIEPDGEEDVFDVQVDHTENFIANGLVSHNTWWSEDDWAGRIQSVMESGEGDVFEVVRYPAINEDGDEYILLKEPNQPIVQILPGDTPPPSDEARLTRPHNTAVHPARYDTEAMLRIKRNLIATGQKRVWQSLYQQNPIPDDGLFFTKEMFRHYATPPHPTQVKYYQAWDFAISEGKESDFTVGVCIAHDAKDNIYVLDVRRFRSDDSIMIVDTILDYYVEYNALPVLGVEDGQIWKAMQAFFERRCAERRIYPSFEILKPLTDKMVRAAPLRGRMQMKKVWFDPKAPWYTALYNELTRFPAGKNDDQVDALSWAIRLSLMYEKPKEPDRTPKFKSWKDKLPGLSQSGSLSHMAA
jgi:predicted phage terminase large subunit-like protein